MNGDDEILEAYEQELAPPPPARRSNRGFWLVTGTMALACVLLIVEIFANRGMKETIGHAQLSLRRAQGAAERILADDGSFAEAAAVDLSAAEPGLIYSEAEEPSAGLDHVSVAASDEGWAGAVQARPGACFYLRMDLEGNAFYGSGEVCSGQEALQAVDTRW